MSKLAVANIIFETTEANRIEYTGNNVVRVRANGGLQIPFGTTAQRVSPEYGIIRFNTDLQTVEMYDAGGWYNMPTGGYVNTIYTAANNAYALANNVAPQIAPSYSTANAAFNTANAAFASANNVAPQVTPAFLTGNLAYALANTVYAAVNSSFTSINASYVTVNADYAFTNSAYASINSNWTVTNALYSVANAAFGVANTKFSSSGGTISGAVEIMADLTVHGNTRFIDQQTLSVGDPLIYLAANNYASDVVDIGFVANYVNATGSNVHTGLYRSSSNKEYYLFYGYDKEPYNNYIDPTGNNIQQAILNSAVRTSNLILGGTNTINWITSNYNTINIAYSVANTSYASINSNWAVTNTAYAASNSNWAVTNTAYSVANASYGLANNAYASINSNWNVTNAAYGAANTKVTTGKAIAMAIVFS